MDVSTPTLVGFVITLVALVLFMVLMYWQLVRVRKTNAGEISVGDGTTGDAGNAE